MRTWIVMVCLVAMTLTGCANPSAELVPPNVNRDELVATIIHQGQEPAHEAPPEPPPPTPLQKTVQYAVAVPFAAGACVVLAPLFLLSLCAQR